MKKRKHEIGARSRDFNFIEKKIVQTSFDSLPITKSKGQIWCKLQLYSKKKEK
jgi:hypothetical protein